MALPVALPPGEITHFRGILPPSWSDSRPRRFPTGRISSGETILRALTPLRDELDAALAREDHTAALRLAYSALAPVAAALAERRGDRLARGQVRIHALMVDLQPLPLEPQADGTLVEKGTAVSISYRNWAVDKRHAQSWARTLTEQFDRLWPGAWFIIAPLVHGAQAAARIWGRRVIR
jgi:hypothetical protein